MLVVSAECLDAVVFWEYLHIVAMGCLYHASVFTSRDEHVDCWSVRVDVHHMFDLSALHLWVPLDAAVSATGSTERLKSFK